MGLEKLRIAINGLAAKSEGALTYLLNILPQFATLEDGCEFIVYLNEIGTRAVAGRLEEARLRLQIRTIRNTQSAVRRILWEQLKFPKLLQSDSIDVLFVPGPSLPWKCPCPAVIAVRNMEPYCSHVWSLVTPRERMRYRYLRWSTEQALRRATYVILVAEATKPLLIPHHKFDPWRIAVIHHGRDPAFRPMPKAEAKTLVREKFGIQKPFILYVSKTRPYKNHVELVKAFALLQQKGRRECLVIAGELQQPYYKQVANWVNALGLSNHIHFLGDVNYDLLPAVYNACEVFAYPSTCEACSNIVIEALSCGLPMAVSDTPVMREIGADAVMYFDAFDPSSIANALDQLLANPKLRSDFGARALQRAQDFSWRRTAERTLEVIRDVAGEGQFRARTQV